MERRLAAILAADVVGYSRLIRADEEGTLERLAALRNEIIDPNIAKHHGRIVKLMGDGMLAEFPSVVDAVRAAAEMQQALAVHNAELPQERRIEFRVGINLGDVVIDGNDIQGDGVNVAARLEGMAQAGGICISGSVYEQVRHRLDFVFTDMGEQAVKNIDQPVRAWHWQPEGTTTAPTDNAPLPSKKPSIAVLPFENMGGDPDQEYFADGITEDIITILSKFRTFSVSARNSTFVYKGTPVDIKQLAGELGVRYVVEGSVRKSGNRVRITAQLIEATSGNHVWAERYDRELEDIFAVQDEITESVVAAIAPEVVTAEIQRAQQKDVQSLGIWESIMRARWHLMRFSKQDNTETKRLLHYATEQDPNSAIAWADLAWSHLFDLSFGWSGSAGDSMAFAAKAAGKAISLDRGDARVQTAQGVVALFSDRHEDAADSLQRAINLNPNDPMAHGYLGLTLAFAGDGSAALPHLEDAMRLSPRDHFMIIWLIGAAWACFAEERLSESLGWIAKARQENSQFPDVYTLLAASSALLGRSEPAQAAAAELMRLMPGLTLSDPRLIRPLKRDQDRSRLFAGLLEAGIPE